MSVTAAPLPGVAPVSAHDAPTLAFLRSGAIVTIGAGVVAAGAVGLLRGVGAGASLLLGTAVPVLVVTAGVLAVSTVTKASPAWSLVAAGLAFLFTVMTVPTLAYAALRLPWVERGWVAAGITTGVLVWQAAATVGWVRGRHAILEEGTS